MPDLTPAQALVDIVVAIIVGVLAYGATSLIALRRDIRKGKVEDVSLFNEVRKAATEQMREMRAEVAELRERVDKAEEKAERNARNSARTRGILREALDHMARLESTLKSQGLTVPERPEVLSGSMLDKVFET